MLTRRAFHSTVAGALSARLFAAPVQSARPNTELENLGSVATGEAQRLKVSYCDIRIVRYRQQNLSMHLKQERDPFAVSLEEKLALVRAAAAEVMKGPGVFSASSNLWFRSEDKYFASSEGSSIQQLVLYSLGEINATAVDRKRALSRSRRYHPPPATAGYEYVPTMNLMENARRVGEEVIEHLKA